MASKPNISALARLAIEAAGLKETPPPNRIPVPKVRQEGRLTKAERWECLLWAVDTAHENGPDSLRGLTIALSRVVQGQALDALLFDSRWHKKSPVDPDQPLWKPSLPLNAAGETMSDLMVMVTEPIRVELADSAVFPYPWERWRMHRALGRIGQGRADGPWKQSNNHFGIGWAPWPIVLLPQGNHSTLAGQLRGGGILTCEESYDLTPVLRAVRTDGRYWYRVDNATKLGAVKVEAMAGIFVVGQRLAGIV